MSAPGPALSTDVRPHRGRQVALRKHGPAAKQHVPGERDRSPGTASSISSRSSVDQRRRADYFLAQQVLAAAWAAVPQTPSAQQSALPKLQQTQSAQEVQSQFGHPPPPLQQAPPHRAAQEAGTAADERAMPAPVMANSDSAAANSFVRDIVKNLRLKDSGTSARADAGVNGPGTEIVPRRSQAFTPQSEGAHRGDASARRRNR